jgi:hypothetical protein
MSQGHIRKSHMMHTAFVPPSMGYYDGIATFEQNALSTNQAST